MRSIRRPGILRGRCRRISPRACKPHRHRAGPAVQMTGEGGGVRWPDRVRSGATSANASRISGSFRVAQEIGRYHERAIPTPAPTTMNRTSRIQSRLRTLTSFTVVVLLLSFNASSGRFLLE